MEIFNDFKFCLRTTKHYLIKDTGHWSNSVKFRIYLQFYFKISSWLKHFLDSSCLFNLKHSEDLSSMISSTSFQSQGQGKEENRSSP